MPNKPEYSFGKRYGLLFHTLKFRCGNVIQILSHIQMASDFTGRTSCHIKKPDKFALGTSFKTFGNVCHARDRRPSQLVTKGGVFRKSVIAR